ncbi:methyltransferase domain-containing protein [Aquibium oceanicum]|uniref:SAM-dependent methyltransferase n=1 Tax=Aquibium oceanicum TaxID=1670800 RepID=A0A1L3SX43_9HYPH|nr:methyltransferase domain-containing protein [Aquibium oceanicum]APH73914.1 SAM-dependent methyltransferase [Aquibium oceanicum]
MDLIFEPGLAVRRKRRALSAAIAGADFLMRRAAEDLEERLGAVERNFASAAAIHCVTPHAADVLAASPKVGEVTRVEADPAFLKGADGVVASGDALGLAPESLDLAVSLLALHEANDLPGQLIQIRRALRPDGLFLACLAGAGTLSELRESLLAAETELTGGASPRVFPFADVRDVGALLQRAGFALPVADVETVTVRYADMFALLRDLRAMGATNVLAGRLRRPTRREVFLRAAELYAQRHGDPDGRVRATFSIVWLSGWAPHESQARPAKRGSANVSLERFLNQDKPG